MHRTTLLASTLAALLAGSASFAFAQASPAPVAQPTTSTSTSAARSTMPMRMRTHDGGHHARGGAWSHDANRERGGVIGDLRELERLYLQAGRSNELTALYNDVLARSQNPRVRDYVYHQLARLQARPANVDQAIATLRKGLDENLANDAKMRSEREKLRSNWQQRSGKAPIPATPAG
jgi:hypothetical protein